MEALQQLVEGTIDFEGQRRTEEIYRVVGSASTALALIMGLASQSMSVCFIIFGANCLLLTLGLAIPWPTFNKHPVTWLPEIQTGSSNKKSE